MKWAKGEALNQSLSCLQTAKKTNSLILYGVLRLLRIFRNYTSTWAENVGTKNIIPSNGFQLQNSLVH